MSQFMGEKKADDAQQAGQPKWPPPKGPEEFLTNDERAFLRRYFGHPEDFPPEFGAYLQDFIAVNIPQIPISQIVGFRQFTGRAVSVGGAESTTSTSYVDLATVGPQLTDIGSGEYVLLFGAEMRNSDGSHSRASVSINGAAPSGGDSIAVQHTGDVSAARALFKTLTETVNTVRVKYVVGAGTGTFSQRWLMALKIGN